MPFICILSYWVSIVSGVCNFLHSVSSQQKLEVVDGPVLQLCVTTQFYLESKGKYILEAWGQANPKDRREEKPLAYFWLLFLCPCPYTPTQSQFSSVAQSCPTLCDPMSCSTPGLPVHHQLPEFTQTHVHRVGDAIQPSHPLLSPSPPALNRSQHQSLFQWVNSSHEVAKVLEFQL